MLAAVIAKLIGVGETSEIEERSQTLWIAAYKTLLVPQCSHLRAIYLEKDGPSINYPYSHYYIVNTKTQFAYFTPNYIDDLVEEDVIQKSF